MVLCRLRWRTSAAFTCRKTRRPRRCRYHAPFGSGDDHAYSRKSCDLNDRHNVSGGCVSVQVLRFSLQTPPYDTAPTGSTSATSLIRHQKHGRRAGGGNYQPPWSLELLRLRDLDTVASITTPQTPFSQSFPCATTGTPTLSNSGWMASSVLSS